MKWKKRHETYSALFMQAPEIRQGGGHGWGSLLIGCLLLFLGLAGTACQQLCPSGASAAAFSACSLSQPAFDSRVPLAFCGYPPVPALGRALPFFVEVSGRNCTGLSLYRQLYHKGIYRKLSV